MACGVRSGGYKALGLIRKDTAGVFILPAALVVLFVLFFWSGPDYYSSRSFKSFWNLGHILFFALLTFYMCSRWKRIEGRFYIQIFVAIGVALFLGGGIELIQGSVQQDKEFGDLARDVIGSMVGLVFSGLHQKRVSLWFLRALRILTFFLVGSQVYPVVVDVSDEWIARRQFPVLSNFETPFEIDRWNGSAGISNSKTVAFDGERSMKVMLGTDTYSGVSLDYFPGDWSGFLGVAFSIFNPDSEEIGITCRIHDREHIGGEELLSDRFNRTFSLPHGWTTIRITAEDILHAPEGRLMDARRIAGVGIFAVRLSQPRVVYIDYVRVLF